MFHLRGISRMLTFSMDNGGTLLEGFEAARSPQGQQQQRIEELAATRAVQVRLVRLFSLIAPTERIH